MNTKPTFPFITVLECDGEEYIGVLKIKSKQYITLYCFNNMPEAKQKELILLAQQWWWQSNRAIPISLFMREEMEEYEKYTLRFNTDACTNVQGPVISLSELPTKRIKRRNIALKRKKK